MVFCVRAVSEWGRGEPADEIFGYLRFAGYELTRDQLDRLRRRQLIAKPLYGLEGWWGTSTTYPAGTAEQMLRIAQLKEKSKQLDEVAWRLWWEGAAVEPALIRSFIEKKAQRWDGHLDEVRGTGGSEVVDEPGGRDVLDEVFFRHLKAPSNTLIGKRLRKAAEIYVGLAGLLVDLLEGEPGMLGVEGEGLFDRREVSEGDQTTAKPRIRPARVTFAELHEKMAASYHAVLRSLDDQELAGARPVALLFSRIIASVGQVVAEGYDGAGRRRDPQAESLLAMTEGADEQVLALLLATSFIRASSLRDIVGDLEPLRVYVPAVSFQDYLRLRYLANVVPGVEVMLQTSGKEAFESPEAAQAWRSSWDAFRSLHGDEFAAAMALRPDLFGGPPDEREVGEDERKVESKKKMKK